MVKNYHIFYILSNIICKFIVLPCKNFFFCKFFFVLAEVCTSCGEKTYSPSVTDDLLKFARNEFQPARIIEVPIFNFVERV